MPVTPAAGRPARRAAARGSQARRPVQGRVARQAGPARGAHPRLARMVKDIRIQRFARQGNTTFCNQAFNAYAARHGFRGFEGLVANQMFREMKSGSGWREVSAQEAIEGAKQGKLVAAAWYNSTPQAGRPDGKRPGHVAAVIGEYAPGVPGIAQAGVQTFEWGPVTASRPNPTYFVRE
jgi:hypothetical protein